MNDSEFEPRRKEFDVLFASGDLTLGYTKALTGALRTSGVRSTCWKLFLGVLSKEAPDNWVAEMAEHRRKYSGLCAEHIVDPHAADEKLDLSVNNPLSQCDESPWTKFFEKAELQKEIEKDLERICILQEDDNFFATEEIHEILLRVLTVWASVNESISYRQGMHELLAVLVLVLVRDKVTRSALSETNAAHPLASVSDGTFVEHDAYELFGRLMVHMGSSFCPQNVKRPAVPRSKLDSVPAIGGAQADDPRQAPAPAVVHMCQRIQHIILRSKDPELYAHLQRLEIEPQIYSLRWVRLLLCREFHVEDVLMLWDAIFAESPDLRLVEYICVAMLMYIRSSLVGMDYAFTLKRLFKYPPVENVQLFVERALMMRNGAAGLNNVAPSLLPSAPAAPSRPKLQQQQTPANRKAMPKSPSEGASRERVLEKELEQYRTTHTAVAHRLDSLATTLSHLCEGNALVEQPLQELQHLKTLLETHSPYSPMDESTSPVAGTPAASPTVPTATASPAKYVGPLRSALAAAPPPTATAATSPRSPAGAAAAAPSASSAAAHAAPQASAAPCPHADALGTVLPTVAHSAATTTTAATAHAVHAAAAAATAGATAAVDPLAAAAVSVSDADFDIDAFLDSR